jgi:kinesin family member 11
MTRVPKSHNGSHSTNQSNEDSQSKNGVNVRVILRCRPMSALEKKDSTNFQVVKTKVETKEVSISQTVPGRKIDSISKTFTFDGVCSPYTTQAELFKLHIVPIVDEVLLGFNCTIFAYGQTGTGKTYTMEGDLYTNSCKFLFFFFIILLNFFFFFN